MEELKTEVNSLVQTLFMTKELPKSIQKQKGHINPIYIYGNLKVHKSIHYSKLRPIISQVSTPTYNSSKYLKQLIAPYTPRKYAPPTNFWTSLEPLNHLEAIWCL